LKIIYGKDSIKNNRYQTERDIAGNNKLKKILLRIIDVIENIK